MIRTIYAQFLSAKNDGKKQNVFLNKINVFLISVDECGWLLVISFYG